MTSLAKNSIVLTAGLGTAQIVSAVTFIVAARLLGPGSYGYVAAVYGVAWFAAAMLDFGAATQGMRALARDGESIDFWRVAPTRAWLTVVFVLLGCGGWILGVDPIICLVPVLAAGLAFEQFACAPSRARGRFGWVAAAFIVDKVVVLIAFTTLRAGDRMSGALALMMALSIGSFAGTAVALKEWGKRLSSLSHLPRTSPWKGSGHFGVGGLAVGLQALDVQLMGWVAGPAVAGAYAAVSKWGAPVTLFAAGVSQVAFPAMAGAKDSSEAEDSFHSARRTLVAPILLLGALAAGAGYLVPLLLGDAYVNSVPTLRVLAIALVLVCMSQPLVAFLQARGQERSTGMILALGTLTQFGALVLLAPVWGAVGGAVAVTLAQLVIWGLTWRAMRRCSAREVPAVVNA